MEFAIKENLTSGIVPLFEDEYYIVDEIGNYTDYLSVIMVNGAIGYATAIGSGVCVEATGEMQRGEATIADMKALSPVFRQAMNMAIERGDKHSACFQVVLDDYNDNGICLPGFEPFFDDVPSFNLNASVEDTLGCKGTIVAINYEKNLYKIKYDRDGQVAPMDGWTSPKRLKPCRVPEKSQVVSDDFAKHSFQNEAKLGFEDTIKFYTLMKGAFAEHPIEQIRIMKPEQIFFTRAGFLLRSQNVMNLATFMNLHKLSFHEKETLECFYKVKEEFLREHTKTEKSSSLDDLISQANAISKQAHELSDKLQKHKDSIDLEH